MTYERQAFISRGFNQRGSLFFWGVFVAIFVF
jgi:hypothetical protein